MGKKVTTNDFIERAISVHGNRFNYDRVNYQNAHGLVEIGCAEHGWFEQAAYSHLNGRGCSKCSNRHQAIKRMYTTEEFIERAQAIHGNRYSYVRSVYTGKDHPISVTCHEHGDFLVSPHNHISKQSGCPECARISRSEKQKGRRRPGVGGRPAWSRDQFIEAARAVHGDEYSYDGLIEYRNVNEHVPIICSKHGVFKQFGSAHLAGQGCPSCPSVISSGHDQISKFLDDLGIEHRNNDRRLIRPYELDIVIPDKSLAIEYCGLYWHCEIHKDVHSHRDKHVACEKIGLRLVTIFEDEWKYRPEVVKTTLKHFCGKSERGINARSVEIREIDWVVAKEFLGRYHLLGSGQSGSKQIGAFCPSGNLIGVQTYGFPSDERGRTDIVEMKRFVTDGRNHPGLGSRMFRWAIRTYGWSRMIAFVDRRWFTGSFKGIAGFRIAEETSPTLYWTDFKNRYKRRFLTKAQLVEMDQFRGTEQTKTAMMNQLGYYRIWDCGKYRLEWTA